MKTSVLLATYNGSRHLPALLDSLMNQTDPDFSVVLQDDGSEDDTVSLLSDLCRKDPRFSFGTEQGQHLGAAGNFLSLIRQTDADYTFLCDQDDLWEKNKIAVLKKAMNEMETEYGTDTPLLVHSDCSLISEEGLSVCDSFFRHQGWDPNAVTLPPLLVQNNVTGCTLIMNVPLRRLIASHAQAKDLFMHDWFIALTAASFGKIRFVGQPLTRYRQHGSNTIGASTQSLLKRGLTALGRRQEAKRRILLTYTHTKAFNDLYEGQFPADAQRIISAYLSTQHMLKLPRILAVRRLGCIMQSPVTRLGQLLFG